MAAFAFQDRLASQQTMDMNTGQWVNALKNILETLSS
jgi:hypothetical protein